MEHPRAVLLARRGAEAATIEESCLRELSIVMRVHQQRIGRLLTSVSILAGAGALLMSRPEPAMAEGIYLRSANAVSGRSAVLEDDGVVAYLFLCKPGPAMVPEKEVFVYSRVPPASTIDWQWVQRTGEMAPISRDIATGSAVIPRPSAGEFSFRWSKDGKAVALMRNGAPLAFLDASRSAGHSKALGKSSPLGNPWDQIGYDALFSK